MNRIIITGASGFLGKKFVEYMLDKNIEVVAVVRNKNKLSDISSDLLKVIELDIKDVSKLIEVAHLMDISDIYNTDAFYHFAWEGTSGSLREDYEVQLNNVKLTCDVVRVAYELGCKKFINAGSLMEYESMKLMETREEKPVGNYLYRSAKLSAHYMAKAEAGRLGIPFINMIISNVYGEGEVSNRFICSTLKKIINDEDIAFTSGEQMYDFIHIGDAVRAFYYVGEKGKAYCDYYIGSGEIKPLKQYIIDMYDTLDIKKKPGLGKIKYDGISLNYDEFNRDSLKKELGFECNVSFMEGIKKTYKWLQETR